MWAKVQQIPTHKHCYLLATILSEGVAVGAFNESNKLIGFATINREFFGENYNYVLIDQLFISLEHRNKGIGKKLFLIIAEIAKELRSLRCLDRMGTGRERFLYSYRFYDGIENDFNGFAIFDLKQNRTIKVYPNMDQAERPLPDGFTW
jgi:GNAT superfamily N-acetyltransferase